MASPQSQTFAPRTEVQAELGEAKMEGTVPPPPPPAH